MKPIFLLGVFDVSSKLREELKTLRIFNPNRRKKFLEQAGVRDTTSSRIGFREWLAFIHRNKPTVDQMIQAVDMKFEKPVGSPLTIHEDIILVRQYMDEFEGPLVVSVNGKLQLTDVGRKVLANVL